MTNIVGNQNRREAAKSQRKLWDVKSGHFIILWDGKLCTEAIYVLSLDKKHAEGHRHQGTDN